MKKIATTLAIVLGATAPVVVADTAATSTAQRQSCAASAEELERFAQTRRDIGLNADAQHVAEVSCAGGTPFDIHVGVPLDASESAEMARRSLLPVGELQAAESKAVPDRFSGIWLDQRQGGVVVAAYTDGGADRLSLLRAMLPAGTEVRVTSGMTTLAELEGIADRLTRIMSSFWADGIHIVGGADDVIAGTYTAYLDESAPEGSEQKIAEAVGGGEALVIERVDPIPIAPGTGLLPLPTP